nr:hypothetical protein XACE116_3230005 [Xanthomonas citri pv. citri]CEJ27256.1 hypothetical protein XACE116_3230005 [Xanthomonas citri pv. citri]
MRLRVYCMTACCDSALQRVDIAQCRDQTSRTLVRFTLGRPVAGALGSALLAPLRAGLARAVAFDVQRLRDRRRAAHIAERGNGDLEDSAAAVDTQLFAAAQRARRLGTLPGHVYLAGVHCVLGQAARLEKARCPQPDIQPDRHRLFQL